MAENKAKYKLEIQQVRQENPFDKYASYPVMVVEVYKVIRFFLELMGSELASIPSVHTLKIFEKRDIHLPGYDRARS